MKKFKIYFLVFFLALATQASAQMMAWQEEQSKEFVRLDFTTGEVFKKNDFGPWALKGHFTEEGVNRSDLFTNVFGAVEVSSSKLGISYLMINVEIN